MPKKTAFIIITIFILLIAGGFLAFYFYSNRGQGNDIIGAGTDNRGNIFPTGSSSSGDGTRNQNDGTVSKTDEQPSGNDSQTTPALKELSTRPSAGAIAIATSSPDSPLVRFVERGTGNVYEVSPKSSVETRLSNTTIPKIEEVLWNKNGTHIIARYTGDDGDSIKTYSASLTRKSADDADMGLSGSFLTENIRVVTKNPEQSKIFYLLQNSAGSVGIVSEFDGTRKTQVFDSLLKEWLVEWPTPTQVALASKPSTGIPGYLFLLNTRTGALTRVISGIKGLTARVNPTGNLALYSESKTEDLLLKIFSFKDGLTREVSITTLPEKCVWSKNDPETLYCSTPSYLPTGNYPDDWYKGLVSFSDEIWKIDSRTGTGELEARLKNYTSKDIDGVNLFMSPEEDYLFFTNKNDFRIWSLRLQS